jgi:hypothetical protein
LPRVGLGSNTTPDVAGAFQVYFNWHDKHNAKLSVLQNSSVFYQREYRQQVQIPSVGRPYKKENKQSLHSKKQGDRKKKRNNGKIFNS